MTSVHAPIRVLIVDDDALVRAGLAMMLAAADTIDIVGHAADGSGILTVVAQQRPDVVLMDIRMPRVDGLAATETLLQQPDPPHIIVLTTFDTDEYVLRALRAGASGFLLKDTPPAQIVDAIHRVAAGEPILSPEVTRKLIHHVASAETDARRNRARHLLDQLSAREREVAIAIGRGASNAEIGTQMHISTGTVKAYVSRMLTKLDLSNRVQIALLTHDAGLV